MWYQHLVILVLLLLVGLSTQEMAQDLEVGGNVTEQKAHALDILKFDLHHTGMPLGILCVILIIAFLKPFFATCKRIPPSIVLLGLGLAIGFFLKLTNSPMKIHLKPDWFFVVLLPFIVMDAGIFLRVHDFFANIGTISLYAIVGTLLSSALTVGLLKFCEDWYVTKGIGILSYLVFGVVISAVDPVAVLSVFEDIEVNERLHILVFGESLLNDGVVIVLYNSINNMLIFGENSLSWSSYGVISISFCVVVGGGICFGLFFGIIGVLLQRVFVQNQALQPILAFCIPYLTYLITDTFGFSGLLAIGTCAVLMKNYSNGNVCLEMQYISEYFFKMAGSYSESAIFILLGLSVVNMEFLDQHDVVFIVVTVVGTLVIRFIVIFFLTFIKNLFARRPTDVIAMRDQFIMAYGGIRGAVCYGLIASVDPKLLPEQDLFTTTTLAVILFTTVIQGFSIRFLVKWLNVEKSNHHEPEKKTVTQSVILQSNKRAMQFLRDLTQEHEESRFYRYIRKLNRQIRKRVCYYQKPTTADLLEDQILGDEEYSGYPKKGTSFSGLPTDSSLINMHLPTSKSELFAAGYREDQLMPPSRPKPSIARPSHAPAETANIPRNYSVTGIVEKAFEESESKDSQKSKRRSYYNRHNLDYVAPAADPQLPDRPDDEPDDSYQLTFPYAKNMNQKLLAATARNISKSLKNKGAHVRFVSPHRASSTYGGDQSTAHYQTYHASTSHSNRAAPPKFTITDEESPSPPRDQKKENRGRPERKVTTGNKTFTIGGGEEMELLPINEDEDSH